MSDKSDHGATTIRPSKGHGAGHGGHSGHSGGGGGGGKWLLGAVAAVALIGGGYAAWQYTTPAHEQTQSAYSDYADNSYADDPLRDSSSIEDENLTAESAAADENITPPPATTQRAAAPARRAAPARAEPVPEASIGITPVNATTADVTESEELVVTGRRAPIWTSTPSARRLSAMYPERALERGREGEARLACVVQDGGALECDRVSETPGGFGSAAVRVARSLRHATTLADGSNAVGTPVNLRVVFRLEDETRRAGL